MAKDGFDGLGKMRMGERPNYTPKPMEGKKPTAQAMGGGEEMEGVHSFHPHPDGTAHTEHPDGSREEHPHHLAALVHIAHKHTGSDKHHMVHHDGMEAHSHSVHEDGQHEDHGTEDPQGALSKFLGEEEHEPEHEDGMEEEAPVMGGM